MALKKDEAQARMAKVITRAWRDKKFAAKLKTKPRAALKEMGLDVPKEATAKLVFHFDSKKERHYVVPAAPEQFDMNDAQLEKLAGRAILGQLVLPTILSS